MHKYGMKLGTYLHSKTGNRYNVLMVARHSETGEELVIYQSLKVNNIYARPRDSFEEVVETRDKLVPRFTYDEQTK